MILARKYHLNFKNFNETNTTVICFFIQLILYFSVICLRAMLGMIYFELLKLGEF